ncbi:hypothetical protein EDD29_6977 [Actinocorallia herbida]|uniref:Uncharacterized protein n=2 Tax=Actinocorallia herbida TaxID=58109 RepID=A0A3N1D865_9ACTN|nr:hypothetical protein EDD29_6977 [Actinocorallia herbida]
MMDTYDRELEEAEGAVGAEIPAARLHRDQWRALEEPADLHLKSGLVELFAAEIAVARLRHDPDHRPCVFDPYHPPASRQAVWRPADAAPRPVACCPADAALLNAGKPPAARKTPSLDGMTPLWDGTETDAYWLLGHHAMTGTAPLTSAYQQTPMGRTLARLLHHR